MTKTDLINHSHSDRPFYFHELCEMGAVQEALEIIAQGGSELCSRDDRGWTPLMRLVAGAAHSTQASSADFERLAEALAPVGDAKAMSPPPFAEGSALMIAARAGHSKLVQILVPWSDLRSHDLAYGTEQDALMLAALKGHRGCVAILASCSPRRQDFKGRTALILAAQAQNHACVEELVPFSDQEHRDSDGMTALAHAVKHGDGCMDSIAALAKHGPSLLIGDGDGRRPLIAAIRAQRWEAARLLIPPRPDELGSPTPLLAVLQLFRTAWSARSQSSELVEIGRMIEAIGERLGSGADDVHEDRHSLSDLLSKESAEVSASRHLLLLIKDLLPLSNLSIVEGPLGGIARAAAISGCEPVLAALASSRSIFEGRPSEPCLASLAMIHGDYSTSFFLMGLWQDPPPNLDLGCPLATAISTKNFDWVERILSLPNPILGRDEHGFTPLMAATQESLLSLVERLVPRSDLLALSSDKHFSALMMAAAAGQTEIAKALLTPTSRAQTSGRHGPAAWICCANSNPDTLEAILDASDASILGELSLTQAGNIQRMVQAAGDNPKPKKCLSLIAPFFAPKALAIAQRHALRAQNAEVLEMLIGVDLPPDPSDFFFAACALRAIPCIEVLWPSFDPAFRDSLGQNAMMRVALAVEEDEFAELFDVVRLLAPHVDLEEKNYHGETARDIFLSQANLIDEDAAQFLAFFDGIVEQRIFGRVIPAADARPVSRRI